MTRLLARTALLAALSIAAPAAFGQTVDAAAEGTVRANADARAAATAPSADASSTDASSTDASSARGPAAGGPLAERGRYLVDGVAMCAQCHSSRTSRGELLDSDYLGGAPVPVPMPRGWAQPWAFRAPRIAGLPQHTDEEFVTLMTTGVNRDGRMLMLPMPQYRMSEDDALAIAAYLRTLR